MARRVVAIHSEPSARGFTLVEMLVVVAVIALLIGAVVPVMASFRAESQSTVCLGNLRQLFVAVETSRQQRKELLPHAAPLPVAAGQIEILPGLPQRLAKIVPERSDVWFCPADDSDDSKEIGTSYIYLPGAFMLFEPPLIVEPPAPQLTPQAQIDRAVRLVSQRYASGYLRHVPLLSDNEEHHKHGSREPWNVVFIDGLARQAKPGDDDVQPPELPEPKP